MKTILIIHHGWGNGGALIALLRLIDELKPNYTIKVLCVFNSEACQYIKDKGVEVIVPNSFFYKYIYKLFIHSEASYFSMASLLKKYYSFVTYILNMFFFAKRTLMQIDFDILYLNSLFLSDWAKAAKKPQSTIIHIREPLKVNHSVFTWIIRKLTNKYSLKQIAVSDDNGSRLKKDSYRVVYDPVNFKNVPDESLDTLDDLKYFTYLGGVQRIKGFEQLIKCLPYLKSNVRVYILGHLEICQSPLVRILRFFMSPYSIKEARLIRRMNQSDKVILVGMTSDVCKYIKTSKAVISPFSKPHASLPILEAFSLGKIVIASDVAGTSELVVDNVNGFLFKNGDYQELANIINMISTASSSYLDSMEHEAFNKYVFLKNKSILINSIIQE